MTRLAPVSPDATAAERPVPLPSLHQALSRSLFLISLCWGVAVAAVVWAVVRHEVDEFMDNTLQESAEIIFGLLSTRAGLESLVDEAAPPMPAPEHTEHLIWQVVNRRHVVLLRSHRAPEEALLPAGTLGFADAGGGWRVYGMQFARPVGGLNDLFLLVAQDGEERREARFDATTYIIAATFAVGLYCAFWLRLRIRRGLRPLSELSDAVRAFDPVRRRDALPEPRVAELAPVHHAITDLAARLVKRVDRERAFAAHAAHALRTPLAGLDAQLAVALRECAEPVRPRLERSREALARLRSVVGALLTLFRTGSEPNRQRLRLEDLVAQLPFEAMDVHWSSEAEIDADPDLLLAALVNLLDNAQRHGATLVVLSVSSMHGEDALEVHDNGCGIEADRRASLQSAIDTQDYMAMNGLGLMLTDIVARAHGGRLWLMSAANGEGCRVVLTFPRSGFAGSTLAGPSPLRI